MTVLILFARATGVLGRATLPHLRTHDIVGLTRSPEKAPLLHELGVEAVVCDVFDRAKRLAVESIAFLLEEDAAEAAEQLEQSTRAFPGDALILRFGRLWGPGTFHDTPPRPPAVHIERVGAEAARLLTDAPAGTYVVS